MVGFNIPAEGERPSAGWISIGVNYLADGVFIGIANDIKHTFDFRGVYSTLLEQWMGVEAAPIVGGTYEQLQPFAA